eukprot:gene20649-16291_t
MADDAPPAAEAPPAEETAAPAAEEAAAEEAAPAAGGEGAAEDTAVAAAPAAEGEAAIPADGEAAPAAEGEGGEGSDAPAVEVEPEEELLKEEDIDMNAEDPGEFDYDECGVKPIFFSGSSQEIYGCVVDGDDPANSVTEEKPVHKIPIKTILDDMVQRAAVSDFSVFKNEIKKFKGDFVVVEYDAEFARGENFFTFLTAESTNKYLEFLGKKQAFADKLAFEEQKKKKKKKKKVEGADGEAEEEEEEEEEESSDEEAEEVEKVARREGPWESLGSEMEVTEVQLPTPRDPLRVVISRRRRYFGAPTNFGDTAWPAEPVEGEEPPPPPKDVTPEGGAVRTMELASSPKDHDDDEDYVEPLQRMLLDMGVQAIPVVESASSQTTWQRPRNATTQYVARQLSDSGTSMSTASSSTETGSGRPSRRSTQAGPAAVDSSRHGSARTRSARGRSAAADDAPPVDPLTAFLNKVSPAINHSLRENEIVDLFSNDFSLLSAGSDVSGQFRAKGSELGEFQSFKFMAEHATTITAVAWHPTIPGVVAVACALKLTFNERVEHPVEQNTCHVLLWRMSNPIDPVVLLEAPDDIYSIAFNPDDPDVLAGGCINGQVVLWNMQLFRSKLERVGAAVRETKTEKIPGETNTTKTPVLRFEAVTAIEYGHRCSIMDVQWFPNEMYINNKGHMLMPPTNTTTQLISIAADETAMVWDVTPPADDKSKSSGIGSKEPPKKKPPPPAWAVRTGSAPWKATIKELDLNWRPTLKVFLNTDANTDNGGRRFCFRPPPKGFKLPTKETDEYDTAPLSSNIFVGTERGSLLYLDWQPPESDTGKLGVQKVKKAMTAHHGPVNTLKRSPLMPDLLLSVGGMSFSIWKEDLLEKPLVEWLTSGPNMTDGEWSPHRPGVFFISKSDGTVDIWDLCDTSYNPTVTTQVCSPSPITALKISPLLSASGQCFMGASDDNAVLHVLEVPVALKQPGKNEVEQIEALIANEVSRIKTSLEPKNFKAAKPPAEEEQDPEEAAKAKRDQYNKVYRSFLETEKQFLLDMGLTVEEAPVEDEL